MIEYLGNTNHLVNWDSFIQDINSVTPMVGYQYSEDRSKSQDPKVIEIANNWINAGYDVSQNLHSHIAWEAWYSGVHFDSSTTDIICDFLKIIPIDMAMVTRLIPGRFAPWHWDVRDSDTENRFNSYKKPIIRIHIHMNKPEVGHVFMVDDFVFYNEEQGSVYKWPNWKSWHGGANCGLTSKYQFSIIGVPV